MSSKDMLDAMLWLSPISKDLLRDVSKSLRGSVPCPPAQLADALGSADISEGALANAEIRKSLVAEIKALKGEVNDKAAASIVDALGKVLSKEIDTIKKAAAAMKGKLKAPKKGILGYTEVASAQKDRTQVLSNDWMIWHSTAIAHDDKSVAKPPDAVLAERTAVTASAPDGPVGELAVSLHILENVGEYIKWEKSLSGSKPPAVGIEVKCPFDDKTANEVAIRRTLTTFLSPDVATAVLAEVAGDASKVSKALQKLVADARKQAVIPMYAAPPAPKEPKDKKAKKGEDGSAKPACGAKAAGGGAGPVVDAHGFSALHAATATQELQWHLLAYRLNPGTVLGRTSEPSAAAAGKPSDKAKSPKQAPAAAPPGKKGAASAAQGAPVSKPDTFQNIWSVAAGLNPPGHTDSSWVSSTEPKANFQTTWAVGGGMPPGHTDMSWRSAVASGAALPSAPAPAPAKKDKAAAKASPKASPKAAPQAAPATGGPVDEAAVKAVGDEIRVLKEKLKADGITGKKLNDHPEIVALVGKLSALKAGGPASAAASPKGKAAASPKSAPAAAPGAVDEAAIKAVGDEIRTLKETLKASGITGKKLNEHPDIVAAVAKLTALKSGK